MIKLFNRNKRIELPGFQGKNQSEVKSSSLPPGYKLQSDGDKFRFVIIGNGHASDAYGTAEYASQLAWHVFNSDDERQRHAGNWKDLA